MSQRDNSSGVRRVARRVQSAALPAVPFPEGLHSKGVWERFTHAPEHVWQRYEISDGKQSRLDRALCCIVLSDMHVGSHANDLSRFQAIVDEVCARPLDLVLLPGDFVNMQVFGGGRVRPDVVAEILSPLVNRYPVVAVLGNHDAEYGRAEIAASLTARNIRVLFNENIALETDAGVVHVAGIEDHSTGQPDVARALAGIPAGSVSLILAHDPASFADVPLGPCVTICGHTHGGQIRLPFVGALLNASAAPMVWTYGHVVDRGRHLIVSAGLGTSGLPWRWNCPPEIVEVVITT